MITGIEYLREAKRILNDTTWPGPKPRLEASGAQFWSALFETSDWPEDLKRRADQITAVLLAAGSVKATVRQMDESTAEQTCRDLLDFVELAEQVDPD